LHDPHVTDALRPTTRAERRAAGALWRSHPSATRKEVVAAARRRRCPADPEAAATGRFYAETMLRPRGRRWWQRHPGGSWSRLGIAAILVAETVWLVSTGRSSLAASWYLSAMAYVMVLLVLLDLGLRRSLRRVAALPTGPSGPALSAEPPS
jgi:hypothetical protein